mmetsp:Transcript_103835/g.161895  ORF Transcript_103835/g.161895 Transcript_103835/m.161895 type:complete len:617 (+) Transcript_103835:57-1907(+)
MGWGGGGKGWGGGGGKGWGGGGSVDPGKMRRRAENDAIKEAKNERESDYFWQTQARIGSSPPYAKKPWQLKEEETEIFGSHSGNVGINFDKYDEIAVEVAGKDSESLQPISSFEELFERYPLPDFIWNNIEKCKYTKPTPIQKYALPVALEGRDGMCCAQTGSGKTCAFLIPVLAGIPEETATGTVGVVVGEPAQPKAVVMAPTRELCSQIHMEARKLTFATKIRASEVYGGVEAKPQLRELCLGSDIVTATPGRLTDFINRGVMSMAQVQYLVLDEADRMLDMGFEPQIREIVQKRDMPSPQDGRMTLMFSATFPKEIQKLAQQFMRQYIWIGVGQVGTAADTVQQNFIHVKKHDKMRQLKQVLKENSADTTLVFVAMKRTAASCVEELNGCGLRAAAIHGDMDQPAREASLRKFKSGQVKILVATDVAARGLDIPTVTHVINMDLPENCEDYVHRIGRTGRVGRDGWATSFYVSEGNWANHKILKGLMEIFAKKDKPVPDVLQQIAREQGMRIPKGGGKGGSSGFGGQDARGVQVNIHKAINTPGKGKSKSSGKPAAPATGGVIKPTITPSSYGKNGKGAAGAAPAAITGLKRPLDDGSGGKGGKDIKRFKGKW